MIGRIQRNKMRTGKSHPEHRMLQKVELTCWEDEIALSKETNASPPCSGLKLMRSSELQLQNTTAHELQHTARGTHKFSRTKHISSPQQLRYEQTKNLTWTFFLTWTKIDLVIIRASLQHDPKPDGPKQN